jgi:hypothetical protein
MIPSLYQRVCTRLYVGILVHLAFLSTCIRITSARTEEEQSGSAWNGTYGVEFSQFQNEIELMQNISGNWRILPDASLKYGGGLSSMEHRTSGRSRSSENFSLTFTGQLNRKWSTGCTVDNSSIEEVDARYRESNFNAFLTWKPRPDFTVTESMGWGTEKTKRDVTAGSAATTTDAGYNHILSASYRKGLTGNTKLYLNLGNSYQERNSAPRSHYRIDGSVTHSLEANSLTVDFTQVHSRDTYFSRVANETRIRHNRDRDLGFTASGSTSGISYTFTSHYGEREEDYSRVPENNSMKENRNIRASCMLPLVGDTSLSLEFERGRIDFEPPGGSPEEESDVRGFTSRLTVPAGTAGTVHFYRSIFLDQFSYPLSPAGLDRDELKILTRGNANYTLFDDVDLDVSFDVEESRMYYLRAVQAVSNYEKLTYRFSPRLGYTLFDGYRISHYGTLSTTYFKYLYQSERSSIYLNHRFSSSLEKKYGDPVRFTLTHTWDRASSGGYVDGTEQEVSFDEDYRKYRNSLEVEFTVTPFPSLSFTMLYDLQYTGIYEKVYDLHKEKYRMRRSKWSLEQDVTLTARMLFFSRGELYLESSKEYTRSKKGAGMKEDFWKFHGGFSYRYQ